MSEKIGQEEGQKPTDSKTEYAAVVKYRNRIKCLEDEVELLKETVRIYKQSDELVKEQSRKVKHLFPLENTVGYGQLVDKVLELEEEKSFFVKAYTEKIMEGS